MAYGEQARDRPAMLAFPDLARSGPARAYGTLRAAQIAQSYGGKSTA
jgi:hypothetical protein